MQAHLSVPCACITSELSMIQDQPRTERISEMPTTRPSDFPEEGFWTVRCSLEAMFPSDFPEEGFWTVRCSLEAMLKRRKAIGFLSSRERQLA